MGRDSLEYDESDMCYSWVIRSVSYHSWKQNKSY